jgi:PucR family transcriptional regulator, purine catabolism regulatory protein
MEACRKRNVIGACTTTERYGSTIEGNIYRADVSSSCLRIKGTRRKKRSQCTRCTSGGVALVQNAHGFRDPIALSLREILRLEVFSGVKVAAGEEGLDRFVRWVHIVEGSDIAPWLRGGELLLTSSFGWPKDPRAQLKIVRSLAKLPIAGILFEIGRFIDTVPRPVLREANKLALPILEAPYGIRFIEVTEAVHSTILDRQYARLTQIEQIHRVLTRTALEADDLETIARTLSRLIDRPVVITNETFQTLAHAGETAGDGRTSLEPFRRPQVQAMLNGPDGKSFLHDLHEAQRPLRFPKIAADPSAEIVVYPIRTPAELLGCLCIVEEGSAIAELDARAVEQTATLAALHILRQREVAFVEDRVRYTFIDALLQGELQRSPGLWERAQLLGFDPDADYAVAVLTIAPDAHGGRRRALSGRAEFNLRERYGSLVRSVLDSLNAGRFLTFQLNQITFLLPGARGWTQIKSQVHRLWKVLNDEEADVPLILTVGEIHRGSSGLRRSHSEAEVLTDIVPVKGLYYYHEHTLAQLLHALEPAILMKLERDTVERLGGEKHAASLMTTLMTLLVTGFNVREAARRLDVHFNTIRHRIDRARKTYGAPLEDPSFWAQIILVAEAHRYGLMGTGKQGFGRVAASYAFLEPDSPSINVNGSYLTLDDRLGLASSRHPKERGQFQ